MPPLLDRLPCQLAYAPSTLDGLLDWLLLDPFRARRPGLKGDEESSSCPLGPAFSVYLMLRAICRQCDRWEALENRKMAAAFVRVLQNSYFSVALSFTVNTNVRTRILYVPNLKSHRVIHIYGLSSPAVTHRTLGLFGILAANSKCQCDMSFWVLSGSWRQRCSSKAF